jgi:Flp pilus assembly protein TadD
MVPVAPRRWLSATGVRSARTLTCVLAAGVAFLGVGCGGSSSPAASGPAPRATTTAKEFTEAMAAAEKALDDGRLDDALRLGIFAAEHDAGPGGHELLGRVWLAHATRSERAGQSEAAGAARRSAADAYEVAAERDGENAALHDAAGMVLDTSGAAERAKAHYARAVEIAPRSLTYRLHLANSLLRSGAASEALSEADTALTIQKDEAWAHAIRAEALLSLGRLAEARGAAEQARTFAPDETTFRVLLARILRAEKRPSDAAELLLALDEDNRATIAVTSELARAWSELGRHADAVKAWEVAYARTSGPDRLTAALEAGRAALAAGNRTDAASWLDIARLLSPNDSRVGSLEAAVRQGG